MYHTVHTIKYFMFSLYINSSIFLKFFLVIILNNCNLISLYICILSPFVFSLCNTDGIKIKLQYVHLVTKLVGMDVVLCSV